MARVGEAVTRTVVCAVKSAQGDGGRWLNPTEVRVPSEQFIKIKLMSQR